MVLVTTMCYLSCALTNEMESHYSICMINYTLLNHVINLVEFIKFCKKIKNFEIFNKDKQKDGHIESNTISGIPKLNSVNT